MKTKAEISAIIEELKKPGRDPRAVFEKPAFRDDVMTIDDVKEGMTLAIEPMVNVGPHEVRELADGWTVKTADHSLSAHYENTVAITENGVEILTL